MRLTGPLAAWAARDPARLCVVDGAVRLGRGDVVDGVARAAALLAGVAARPRVAVLAGGSWPMLRLMFGALWAGGLHCPMNSRWSADDLLAALALVAPQVLAADQFPVVDAADLRRRLPSLKLLLWLGRGSVPDGWTGIGDADWLAPRPQDGGSAREAACLFFTSGTSGRAKAATLTHRNLLWNALNARRAFGLDEGSVQLHSQPLFHLAGGARLFNVALTGGCHVMMERFEVGALVRLVAAERVTHIGLVPTMLQMLLEHPDTAAADLSSLRVIGYGAAPMPPALLRRALARLPGVGFVQSYGMTELSPVATSLGIEDHRGDPERNPRLASVGRAVRHVRLAIRDPGGGACPAGVAGEVCVAGPTVMAGYWRDPAATAAVLRDGWLHTGDAGYLDADGYLFLVDRLKDIIISGGENIASIEVEAVLAAHPAVRECAVVAAPHPHWGEMVHAFVATVHAVEADVLDRHCRAGLSAFKVPRGWTIGPEPLPRNAVGKVEKERLRARLRAGAG